MLFKTDFARYLSQKGYTISDSKTITNDVIDAIKEVLSSGESVYFYGFGTFEIRKKRRKNKNTGKWCIYYEPEFIPGNGLLNAVEENLPPFDV